MMRTLFYFMIAKAEPNNLPKAAFPVFNPKEMTSSEVAFYLGTLVITLLVISYLFWRSMKRSREEIKGELPEETISLRVKTKEELERAQKYEEEIEKSLKKRYPKRK